MPARRVIDSHVHLFDHQRVSYSWMPGRGASLTKPHLPQTLLGSGLRTIVDGMVFVEAHADNAAYLEEARFAQDLMDREPSVVAIIADAPVERGAAVVKDLEALKQLRGVRGIRRFPGSDPGRSLDDDFLEGVRAVGRLDLSFEFGLLHPALPYALEVARRCPDVQFVLNHIGLPDIAHDLREPWWSLIREMGRLPNVMCKISGAVAGAKRVGWTAADVRPYVAHAIESFGFDRSMFGSDWPVSDLKHSYDSWVDLVEDAASGASEEEKEKLFRTNAIRHYRIAHGSVEASTGARS